MPFYDIAITNIEELCKASKANAESLISFVDFRDYGIEDRVWTSILTNGYFTRLTINTTTGNRARSTKYRPHDEEEEEREKLFECSELEHIFRFQMNEIYYVFVARKMTDNRSLALTQLRLWENQKHAFFYEKIFSTFPLWQKIIVFLSWWHDML